MLLYRALLRLPRGNHTAEELGHLLLSLAKFPESERGQLNWRSGNRLVGQESSFEQELSSAEQYAQSAFGSIAETMQSRTYVAST